MAGLGTDTLRASDVSGKTLALWGWSHRRGGGQTRHRFSMRLLYFARSVKPEMDALGGRRVTFDEILRRSRISFSPRPLDADTRHLFGETEFSEDETDGVFHQHGPWRRGR